jgi:hypothetical protein
MCDQPAAMRLRRSDAQLVPTIDGRGTANSTPVGERYGMRSSSRLVMLNFELHNRVTAAAQRLGAFAR